MRGSALWVVSLLTGCAHAVLAIDTSDLSRVKMGCVRFAAPSGWEVRDTTSETIVLQPAGGPQDGDLILIDSESNQGRNLSEWVNETTNAGTVPAGLTYNELQLRGRRAWLAEAKGAPIQLFVIEGGGRYFHFRKMRGDKAAFEKLWRSIELEGCSS